MHPHPEQVTRRSLLKKGLRYFAALVGSTGLYSLFGERHWLQIKQVAITLPRLPKAFQGLKIVQFSDVHLGHYYEAKELQEIVQQIARMAPDMICFTGDLVDEEISSLNDSGPVLSQLKAPLGKYAVLGNHDYLAGGKKVAESLQTAGFQVLLNRHIRIDRGAASLYIAGVDEVFYGQPDIKLALAGIPEGACTILLAHEPDVADETADNPVDLQLSGHSHGGQVRLPLIGEVLTPPMGKKYPDGLQKVSGKTLQVYTNRGLGTTIAPIRFLCRPELTVITVNQ